MGIFGNVLDWVIAIFLFGTLLFIHEAGHFAMARLCGVKVDEFGFGFPPRVKKLFTWRGTLFSINAIPFGAFVKPAGEDDPSIPGGLASAPKRVRALVMLGGVLFNLIFALGAFTVTYKIAYPEGVAIAAVAPQSPALDAGIIAGDRIRSLDALPIRTIQEVTDYVHAHLGEQISVTILRGGEQVNLTVVPRTTWPEGQGPTGISLTTLFSDKHNWWEAFTAGLGFAGEQLKAVAQLPAKLLQGGADSANYRPVGPVGIIDVTEQIVGAARENNRWVVILDWMGSINLALAIGNLLPIPALDGGRLLFIFVEAIRGRRVKPERERMLQATTLLLLLGLMLVVTYLDFFSPVLPR
jgi:regulator of sigma E protease